jgi:hypothetical protein
MATPRFITLPEEASKELFYFLFRNPEEFPEPVRERLIRLVEPGRSWSQSVADAAEIIYANQKGLSKKALALGAELAICASHNNIATFAENGGKRGRGVMEALRRASGEKTPPGMSWPPKDQDPEIKVAFVPPPDSDAVSVPAPEPGAP